MKVKDLIDFNPDADIMFEQNGHTFDIVSISWNGDDYDGERDIKKEKENTEFVYLSIINNNESM